MRIDLQIKDILFGKIFWWPFDGFRIIVLKLIDNASILNKQNHGRDGVLSIGSLLVQCYAILFLCCLSSFSFYDNCRNSRSLIGLFSLSISGQTHYFIIYAMGQRARADNYTKLVSAFYASVLLLTMNFFITLSK